MRLKHDGEDILIDVSWPNTQQVMAIAVLPDRTLAEFGSSREEATRRILRRLSTVMVDAGRPMLTVRQMTLVLDELSRAA
jgi:hypothetical protein